MGRLTLNQAEASRAMTRDRLPLSFAPITSDYNFQKVAAAIRQSIMQGELIPGDRLPPQRQLQAMFGVSKVTILGALRVLEADDFIRTQVGRNGGAVVLDPGARALERGIDLLVNMDRANLDEVRELRLAVEVMAARLAAERALPEHVARLEALVSQLEAVARHPSSPAGVEAYSQLDREFHLTLADASGNRLLRACVAMFSNFIRRRPVHVAPRLQRKLDASLRRLVDDGIKTRSPDTAAAAITQHLMDSFAVRLTAAPRRAPFQPRSTLQR